MFCDGNFGATQFRLTGADLQKFQSSEASLNSQYGASIKTEHAFNGLGILDVVRAMGAKQYTHHICGSLPTLTYFLCPTS